MMLSNQGIWGIRLNMGVAFGPGHPLIRHEALGSGPVSAATPNAIGYTY
jgi:hypothetical protein